MTEQNLRAGDLACGRPAPHRDEWPLYLQMTHFAVKQAADRFNVR
jgi:hypothetical protein